MFHLLSLCLVPNAPCGVESFIPHTFNGCSNLFLMHRVELKDGKAIFVPFEEEEFLMHRVELKAALRIWPSWSLILVPNAPCGVESFTIANGSYMQGVVPNAPCGVERIVP